MPYTCTFGKRKRSVAKCKVYPDQATEITINGKQLPEYLPQFYVDRIKEVIRLMNLDAFKIELFVKGGGTTGQADSCRLALAKAGCLINPDIKPVAKSQKLLRRDPRIVLPKRPGLKKHRKGPTYVKR